MIVRHNSSAFDKSPLQWIDEISTFLTFQESSVQHTRRSKYRMSASSEGKNHLFCWACSTDLRADTFASHTTFLRFPVRWKTNVPWRICVRKPGLPQSSKHAFWCVHHFATNRCHCTSTRRWFDLEKSSGYLPSHPVEQTLRSVSCEDMPLELDRLSVDSIQILHSS